MRAIFNIGKFRQLRQDTTFTKLSRLVPGSPERTSHVGAVQILSQIHQCQKRAQNPCLQIVGQMQSARRHSRKFFALLRDKSHDFPLTVVRRISQRCFAAHLRAGRLQRQREMKNADPLLGKGRRSLVLASCNVARCSHNLRYALHDRLQRNRRKSSPPLSNDAKYAQAAVVSNCKRQSACCAS